MHKAKYSLSDWLELVIAVGGISCTGPLAAYAHDAPGLSIALWRNLLSSLVFWIMFFIQHKKIIASGYNIRMAILSGIMLGLHFGLWIPSLSMTSVGASTALVCLTSVWSCVISKFRGEQVDKLVWLGVCVCVMGGVLVTGWSMQGYTRELQGDAMALIAGICMAIYLHLGSEARKELSPTHYALISHSSSAIFLMLLCLTFGSTLSHWPQHAWLAIFALTIAGQFCGHFMLTKALQTFPISVVSLVNILEIPGAALLAFIFLGEKIGLIKWLGIIIILVGLIIVISGMRHDSLPDKATST